MATKCMTPDPRGSRSTPWPAAATGPRTRRREKATGPGSCSAGPRKHPRLDMTNAGGDPGGQWTVGEVVDVHHMTSRGLPLGAGGHPAPAQPVRVQPRIPGCYRLQGRYPTRNTGTGVRKAHHRRHVPGGWGPLLGGPGRNQRPLPADRRGPRQGRAGWCGRYHGPLQRAGAGQVGPYWERGSVIAHLRLRRPDSEMTTVRANAEQADAGR